MTNHVMQVKHEHPINNKIGGVFMHVSNMERSVNWYHQLFGMPDRSSVTHKVHDIKMNAGSGFVLDQHGYDRGLAMKDRPILMIDSPDVHAAYRFVKELGIAIEWEIEQYPGMAFFTIRDPDGNLIMICGTPGSDSRDKEHDRSALPVQEGTIRYDGGGTWLEVSHSSYSKEVTAEGLLMTGRAYTECAFPAPLKIETTVRLEGGCLRLLYGKSGQLTFNFGPSENGGAGEEFYLTHPKVNKHFNYIHKGGIPVGEWVHIEWTLRERSMEVRVNGTMYHKQDGYFGDFEGKAGIGCDNGRITVRTFVVESLAEEEIKPRLSVVSGTEAKMDWLVPDAACYPMLTLEGMWLTCDDKWGSALTLQTYTVPFTLTATLRSDMSSVVLYGGVSARVKFHPEGSFSFLDPVTKEEIWVEKMGKLPVELTKVTWTMEETGTKVSVDGDLRFERQGDYSGCRFRLGVGADLGSVVVVQSVNIE